MTTFDHPPRMPKRLDWRIGCVGAGFVLSDCHLVAYRAAGFNPVAIASRNIEKAEAVAKRHSIPRVHNSLEELFRDSTIEVLDFAVPPQVQPELIRRAVEMGKGRLRGILAQKPLALNGTEGRELVELCEAAGVVLAVNQNMRFDQSIRAMKNLLNRGELGEPVFASIDMRAVPHWMPWAEGLPSLSTFVMSIHHLDTFRYWFGTPDRVLASTRTDPRTKFPHRDGLNLYILEWEAGMRASAWDDVWSAPNELSGRDDLRRINWRVEGTEGVALGTIGWPKYPERTPSTLDYSTNYEPGVWHRSDWNEVWFPDAFAGTMAQLLVAIEEGATPEIGGRDNLETLALCEAVFAGATEHRITRPRDFLHPGPPS